MHSKPRLLRHIRDWNNWRKWFALLLVGIAGAWLSDVLKGQILFGPGWCELLKSFDSTCWLLTDKEQFFWGLGTAIALAACAGAFGVHEIGKLYKVRLVQQTDRVTPHQGLIMLLSPSSLEIDEAAGEIYAKASPSKRRHLVTPSAQQSAAGSSLTIELNALELDDDFRGWNWIQLLRGLAPHLTTASAPLQVVVIASADFGDTAGSRHQAEICKRWLGALMPQAHVDIHPTPVQFHDLRALNQAFDEAISHLNKQGLPDHELIIDVTSGQKVASIAAANATLHRGVKCQYVNAFKAAGKSTHNVVMFDLEGTSN